VPSDADTFIGSPASLRPSDNPTSAGTPFSRAIPGEYTESGQHVLTPGYLLAQRYEVLGLLGEGGMGAVYKARDVELGRMVALKVIRRELAGNRAILDRFKQELILATQVTHKNVVRIYDLGEADGTNSSRWSSSRAKTSAPLSISEPSFRRWTRWRLSSRCAARSKPRTAWA